MIANIFWVQKVCEGQTNEAYEVNKRKLVSSAIKNKLLLIIGWKLRRYCVVLETKQWLICSFRKEHHDKAGQMQDGVALNLD